MSTSADRKLLAIGMKAVKLGGKELLALIEKALELLKSGETKAITMPYEEFQQSGGVPLLNLSPTEKEWERFAEIAKQNEVNFTLKKDREHDTYYLCLQGDEKAIMKALSDYLKQVRESRTRQPSIVSELEKVKNQPHQAAQNKEKSQNHEKDR